MSAIVIALEGVLAGRPDEDVDLLHSQLEPTGALLYGSLARAGKLVLATNQPRRLVDHWCRTNGVHGYSSVVPLNERAVIALRAGGENVTLYIDADPARAAAALRNGVPTLLFSRPLYARASHRPDLPQLKRPWAELVAESKAQRSARSVSVPDDEVYES